MGSIGKAFEKVGGHGFGEAEEFWGKGFPGGAVEEADDEFGAGFEADFGFGEAEDGGEGGGGEGEGDGVDGGEGGEETGGAEAGGVGGADAANAAVGVDFFARVIDGEDLRFDFDPGSVGEFNFGEAEGEGSGFADEADADAADFGDFAHDSGSGGDAGEAADGVGGDEDGLDGITDGRGVGVDFLLEAEFEVGVAGGIGGEAQSNGGQEGQQRRGRIVQTSKSIAL